MAFRKRRPAYTVCVENLPMHVTETDVIKKFSSFGDIQSIFLKNGPTKTSKMAFIKFQSELDAVKAVNEVNGGMWFNNVINAKKCEKNSAPQKKFEDKHNANKTKHIQNYSWYNYNPFPPFPNFVPNAFGNLFRGISPRGLYLPYGPFHPKPPLPNFNSGSRTSNLQKLSYSEDRYMLCTYVEDAVTFYGQYAAKSNILGQITSYLQQICPSLPRLAKTPEYGRLYAAIYSGDGLWYRCKVQNNRNPNKTYVQYIDYGNSEELDYRQLCELPESLRNQPCLAPKCVLMNLAPCDGSSSKQALFYLQETILGQHLVVTTCSAEDSPVYEVSKCICDSKDIISKLVEQKYACSKLIVNGLTSNNPSVISANIPPSQTKLSGKVAIPETKDIKNQPPSDGKDKEIEAEDKNTSFSSVQKNNEITEQQNNSLAVQEIREAEVGDLQNSFPPLVNSSETEEDTVLPDPLSSCKGSDDGETEMASSPPSPDRRNCETKVEEPNDSTDQRTQESASDTNSEGKETESGGALELEPEKSQLENELSYLKSKCEKLEKDIEEKETALVKCSVYFKLESVAKLLQRVNSLRSSLLVDCSVVSRVVSLLKKADAMLRKPQQELQNKIQEAFSLYHQSLKAVLPKTVKDQDKKNCYRDMLCAHLSEYITMYNDSAMEKLVEELNDALVKLGSLEKSSVDAWITKDISSLDELIKAYESLKVSKKPFCVEAQQSTDRAHRAFFEAFAKLEMVFMLYPAKSNDSNHVVNSSHVNIESSLSSFSCAVSELEKALEYEIDTIHSAEGNSSCEPGMSVIEYLIGLVADALENVEEESEVLQKYSSQLSNFTSFSSLQPMVDQVCDIRKEICSIKSKLRQTLADKKALEEVKNCDKNAISKITGAIVELQRNLHYAFVEEDYSLKFFAKSFEASFQELELEYPELMLTNYMNSGIMRHDMELEHFTCRELPERIDTCYESAFVDKPVIIKEFLLDSEEKSKQLEEKILSWNAIESPYLVEVLVVFEKNHQQFFVMMPRMYSLCEKVSGPVLRSPSKCCEILISVLNSLKILHSHNIVHGMIHPSTVLLDKDSVALDFMFETASWHVLDVEFQGISFQAPELSQGIGASKASDMFAFGCLVLSLLFSDVEFKTDPSVCPHLKNFRSIVESQLSAEDSATLMSLLSPTIGKRPSAEMLLNSGFLKQMLYKSKETCVKNSATQTKCAPLANGALDYETAETTKSHKPVQGHEQQNARSTASILHQVSSLRKPLNCGGNSTDSCYGAVVVDNDVGSQLNGSICKRLGSSCINSQQPNIPSAVRDLVPN